VAGVIVVSDSLRPSSREAVQKLQGMGVDVLLLTGDRLATAEAIAKEIGVSRVVAEVLPQDKVAEIRRLQKLGRVVAMVGDGINDAPALAQSDVGISMPKGTDIAIEASDIALMRSDLRGVPSAISLSRKTMATMKQNLFWAFVYNVIGIPIAAGRALSAHRTDVEPDHRERSDGIQLGERGYEQPPTAPRTHRVRNPMERI